MDDAARLVTELHNKLADLDGKVAAYQRNMLAEFHRHMEECLKNYPDHISSEVSRVIAQSMSRYPALCAGVGDAPDSPAIDRNAWDGSKSPPPILRHTSGTPKESPRSAHAREQEFHGLFTPSYLPLLESNPSSRRSSEASQAPAAGKPSLPLSFDNVKRIEDPRQPASAVVEPRPAPNRRLTDRSTSSVESSSSESKLRRSALRRSSGSNRGSPRRVRFEFDGEEVFPSSSLAQAPNSTPVLVGGAEPQPKADTAIAVGDESPAYAGTSLLGIDNEGGLSPKPKKVSSTQALQALTRSPLEEGTIWTVVNPDPGEPVIMKGGNQIEDAQNPCPIKVDSQATIRPTDIGGDVVPANGFGSPIEEIGKYDEDENTSEDDFLSIRPTKKTPSPVAQRPFTRPPSQVTSAAPGAATTPGPANHEDVDEDDPLFDFEEGGQPLSQSQGNPQKYLPEPEDDEDELISQRRPRSLGKAKEDERERETGKPPAVSPSSALFGHSIGSYRGRSMSINPINDPELYDEIANMKDVHFFVGSIDGRTGVDQADLGSYRATSLATNLVGTPRSFTQRLALEEAMERRRAAEKKDEDE
ncbi:hypothetical protein MMYC01_209057 [Madurella mycetomatis]|uniref:Uncharacterized protein n=1 Tax=Madurella mycetomatis TaxID=100816 RepID=A0A175VRX3_9PEZI|nr:hypothetical protein MMYC01_209057 [Madurella mycetomatis]